MSYSKIGQDILENYKLQNETINDMYLRVANAYAEGEDHKQRIYNYLIKKKCMFATPF